MNRLTLKELKNYLGYVVRIDHSLYTLIDVVNDSEIVICSENGHSLWHSREFTDVEVLGFKRGYSPKSLLTTFERIGIKGDNFYASYFKNIVAFPGNRDIFIRQSKVTRTTLVVDDRLDDVYVSLDDTVDCLYVYTINYSTKKREEFCILGNDTYKIASVSYTKNYERVYKEYMNRDEFFIRRHFRLPCRDSESYVINEDGIVMELIDWRGEGKSKYGFHRTDTFSKLNSYFSNIKNYCIYKMYDNYYMRYYILFNIPNKYFNKISIQELVDKQHISDLSKVVGKTIGTYVKSDKLYDLLNNKKIDLKALGICDKLESLFKVKDVVELKKFYTSKNGFRYITVFKSNGIILIYFIEIPVYSAHNVKLYTRIHRGYVFKSFSESKYDEETIMENRILDIYRTEEEREKLYKYYIKHIDWLINPEYKKRVNTGYESGRFFIYDIKDGIKTMDVYFTNSETLGKYSFMVNKEIKKVIMTEPPISIKKEELKGLINSIKAVDKDILNIKESKYVIYSYDGKNIKISESKPIDVCYSLGDCSRICKNRHGGKFLIVEYGKDSIIGYKKLYKVGNNNDLIINLENAKEVN